MLRVGWGSGGFRIARWDLSGVSGGVGVRWSSSSSPDSAASMVGGRSTSAADPFGDFNRTSARSSTTLSGEKKPIKSIFDGITEAFEALPPVNSKGRAPRRPTQNTTALAPGIEPVVTVKNTTELAKKMESLFTHRHYSECMNLFVRSTSVENKIVPNRVCYLYATAASGKCNYALLAQKLLDEMVSKGMEPTEMVYRSVLEGCKGKEFRYESLQILENMRDRGIAPNIETYNSVLRSFVATSDERGVTSILDEIQREGLELTADTYRIMIEGKLQFSSLEAAWDLVEEAERLGIKLNDNIYVSLLCLASREGAMELCEPLFEKVSGMQRQLISIGLYTDLIRSSSKALNVAMTSKLLERFRNDYPAVALPKDAQIMAINIFGKTRRFEDAFRMMREIDTPAKTQVSIQDFEVLLDGLSRSPEDVDTAYYVLESQRDVGETVTILQVNAVIGGCARLGDVNRTMQTFEALESAFGLKPNTETYNMLFLMAGVSGEISRVSTLVQEMKSVRVQPDATSFELLTQMLLRANRIKSAVQMLENGVTSGVQPTLNTLISVVQKEEMMRKKNPEGYAKQNISYAERMRKLGAQVSFASNRLSLLQPFVGRRSPNGGPQKRESRRDTSVNEKRAEGNRAVGAKNLKRDGGKEEQGRRAAVSQKAEESTVGPFAQERRDTSFKSEEGEEAMKAEDPTDGSADVPPSILKEGATQ